MAAAENAMIDLPRVASRLFGTPTTIARVKLDVAPGVLAPRLAGGALARIEAAAASVGRRSLPIYAHDILISQRRPASDGARQQHTNTRARPSP
jgi:hypothetical protein